MKDFLTLLKKDLRLEFRIKEMISVYLAMSLIFSVVIAFGISSAFLYQEETLRLYPAVLWSLFFFIATATIGRSFEYELENNVLSAVVLSGVSPALIYLSKSLSNSFVMGAGHLFSVLVLAVLLNVDLRPFALNLGLISLLSVTAYSFLATLCAFFSSVSRLKNLLLPFILLPLLFPLILAALESSQLLISGAIEFSFGSFWPSLLILLNVVYLILGLTLFKFALRE
jgi:heme exporter protein B